MRLRSSGTQALPLPLACVDLFSGIGGNAYALRSFTRTVLYCDNDAAAVSILRSAMAKGLIDEAPVHGDVRTLPAQACDMLCAGWPCQGNSALGKHEGMEDCRSGLLREVARLAEARPSVVFLENVPLALNNGSFAFILKKLRALGYDVAWGVLGADDVGRPHARRRLFVLAALHRPTLRACVRLSRAAALEDCGDEPRRMLHESRLRPDARATDARRSRALGNSVVPQAVKRAFELLGDALLGKGPASLHRAPKFPSWGVTRGDRLYGIAFRRSAPSPERLVFAATAVESSQRKLPLVARHAAKRWATPRRSNVSSSRSLTRRTARDLATQVRHEQSTPARDRGGYLSADFVEWLMGFPPGYTDH